MDIKKPRHTIAASVQMAGSMSAAGIARPNIIFINDLGWRDVSSQSEGEFLTPDIDRMANEGMRDKLLDDLLGWMKSVNARLPSGKNLSYGPGGAKRAVKKKGEAISKASDADL